MAAKWGKVSVARVLLEAGAIVNARTRDGLTPLHCAARSGFPEMVELLLNAGADSSAKTRVSVRPWQMTYFYKFTKLVYDAR
ncbi:unnamed protein product [Protopolystoma xenopodis]|uniref:Uncharacterized protein n=1 Tax=Protopolystoma xenopodis TaxID=117903 RepID=A0A448WZC5_9PLAT|nr:unnamed protein product [Protopolystoma xenopodis]